MELLGIEVGTPRYVPTTAWLKHGPFAMWLVRLLAPRTIVELGTHYGYSYFAMCQAVAEANLATRCFAVDTWKGDEHAGLYGEDVYEAVVKANANFKGFSRLIRKRFSDAKEDFADGSVDLLHVDGRHYYEDVKEDFETWIPKLSNRAVVLFHDTEVRDRNFGVHKYWRELSAGRPSLNFTYEHGLGVLLWGNAPSEQAMRIFGGESSSSDADFLEGFFMAAGLMFEQEAGLSPGLRQLSSREAALGGDPHHGADVATLPAIGKRRESAGMNSVILPRKGGEDIETAIRQSLRAAGNGSASAPQDGGARRPRDDARAGGPGPDAGETKLAEAAALASPDAKAAAAMKARARDMSFQRVLRTLRRRRRFRKDIGARDFLMLKKSPLFDEEFYLMSNPDVAASKIDAVAHYLKYGAAEGRDPGPYFSERGYKLLYADVASSGMPALLHFEKFGRDEGRLIAGEASACATEQIEETREADNVPAPAAPSAGDEPAAAEPRDSGDMPVPSLLHDDRWKILEPLVREYFDADWYRGKYPDLRDMDDEQAFAHFAEFGASELRNPSKRFDAAYYARMNPDLTGWNPLAHYLLHGRSERRQPKLFSLDDFLEVKPAETPVVGAEAASEATNRVCCLVHVYYPDLIDELLDYVDNVPGERDVFVNLVTTTWSVEAHARIIERIPDAHIIVSPDHGRDIGGFARLLSNLRVDDYDIFLFVHSKKSPHLPAEVGREWRRDLLEPIVGSAEIASECLAHMRANPRIGLVGASKWRHGEVNNNSEKYDELLNVALVSPENRECDYVSGTMFFVKRPVVRRLNGVMRSIVFEDGSAADLSFHMDGQYAHAIERLVGNLVREEGMFIWYK